MTRNFALLAFLLAACSGEGSASSTTTEPEVVETVTLRLQDDGTWTCAGEPGECCEFAEESVRDGATPPEPLGAP